MREPKIVELVFEQPPKDTFGSQLKEVTDFLTFYQDVHQSGDILKFNLSGIRFVHPLMVLGLSAIIDHLHNTGTDTLIDPPKSEKCASYLNVIRFPDGIRPDKLGDWRSVLNAYIGKSYLPIINFSASKLPGKSEITNQVFSSLMRIIKDYLQLDYEYEAAINLLISEIADNIEQHSGIERGWLMIQYYQKSDFIDICIIDTGKTILGSYKEFGHDVEGDDQAISLALRGISTKYREGNERGTGLSTTKSLSKGLQGDFALFSGKGLYFHDRVMSLPVSWPGTFVAIRIRKNVEGFKYIDHL